MTFRRQDIPKTTRKQEEGGRRLYPRFPRDRMIVPKVELAIAYLDRMVGHRRGELSPDVVLELFGDPKLSRCLLACMGETYRYRTRTFADAIGCEASARLAQLGLTTPAELRGFLYLAANVTHGGFVGDADRPVFLAERGEALGLTAAEIEELTHLDAERNAELVRIGNRPSAEDVVARYNATLVLSVLRHASLVTLTLPGLSRVEITAVCARHGIEPEWTGAEAIRVRGRKSAVGTWSGFGARLGRCALHLMALCPRTPEGDARVHFGEQTLSLEIDGKLAAMVRPKLRAAADGAGLEWATALAEALAKHRQATGELTGWTVRRWPEPVVVEGALVLPELVLMREQASVAIVPVPAGTGSKTALAAIERAHAVRPVIALAEGPLLSAAPVLTIGDGADGLIALLDELAPEAVAGQSPLERVATELAADGWVAWAELVSFLREPVDIAAAVAPLTTRDEAVLLPGVGLCAKGVVVWLQELLGGGPIDIGALRAAALDAVGDPAAADALTLHVLGAATLRVSSTVEPRAA